MTDRGSAPGIPRLGVSVCVWKGADLLLIRRARPPMAGLWAPVGGMVEWGETLEAAALREVHEEAAIACTIKGLAGWRDLIFPGPGGAVERHVVLAVLAATWRAGEPVAGDDADAAAWVDPSRLADMACVPGLDPYVAASRAVLDAAR